MDIEIMKETLKHLEDRHLVLVEQTSDSYGTYTTIADDKYGDAVEEALKFAIANAADSKKETPADVVPMSKELKKDDDHVRLICKAFIYDGKWYDGTNMRAKRQYVWKRTVSDSEGHDVEVYSFYDDYGRTKKAEQLFMPTDAEIEAALEEFKKKGWHAQYDNECGYYAVFQGTRALGEHQARYTYNIF